MPNTNNSPPTLLWHYRFDLSKTLCITKMHSNIEDLKINYSGQKIFLKTLISAVGMLKCSSDSLLKPKLHFYNLEHFKIFINIYMHVKINIDTNPLHLFVLLLHINEPKIMVSQLGNE